MSDGSGVALLFSGGLDSAAAAVLLAAEHPRVHLLTWDHGHGHVLVGRAAGPAADLAGAFPGRIEHHRGSCAALFRKLVTDDLRATWTRYGSRFVWCLGCKLAMHTETLRYCLAHGLGAAADGSSAETGYYVEQSPVGLRLIRGLYREFGIGFATPVHRLATRAEERRLLAVHGVRRGIALRDRNPGTQPLCLPGNALHLMSTLAGAHRDYPEDAVTAFFEEKAPLCRDWIRGAAHG